MQWLSGCHTQDPDPHRRELPPFHRPCSRASRQLLGWHRLRNILERTPSTHHCEPRFYSARAQPSELRQLSCPSFHPPVGKTDLLPKGRRLSAGPTRHVDLIRTYG